MADSPRPADAAARPARWWESTPFTGRAVVLALVMVTLFVSLALPVREYLQQRSEIGALAATEREREQRVAELQSRLARWRDPAFVEAQARERLQYVMPGEVGYVVLGPDEAPAPVPGGAAREESGEAAWYQRLWSSVEKADAVPPATPRPPAPRPTPAPTSRG